MKRIFATAVLLVSSMVLCAGSVAAQGTGERKRILLLSSHESHLPAQVTLERSIRSTLENGSPVPAEVYSEYLDAVRTSIEDYEQELVIQLQRKYGGKKFDLVFAINPPALEMLLRNRTALFPDTPIVFLVLDQSDVSAIDPYPNMTGVWGENDYGSNLELALSLHPGTKRVLVISGVSEWDKYWMARVQNDLRAFVGKVEFSYVTGLSPSELKTALAELPRQTIVMFVSSVQDNAGNNYGNLEVLGQIAPDSGAPVYGASDAHLGLGIVGGRLMSIEALGARGAHVGLRVLAGERPEDIPPHGIPSVPMFDWRQLQRWGISEANLPEGSIVQFKEPTLWEEYKWYIVGLALILVAESFLIGLLLYLRYRRREAEAQTTRLHSRLKEIVANVPGIVWESRTKPGTDQRTTTFISDYVQRMLGYTPEEWLKQPPGFGLSAVSEDDRERVRRETDAVIETGNEAVSEYRWRTKDGGVRWVENHIAPIVDEEKGVVGLRGVALDVTERKAAEEALRESESLNHTILSSLNTHVCVLDGDGRIISVNHSWTAFALDNGLTSEASVGLGVNYLDVCRRAPTEGDEMGRVALDGVRAVCGGTQEYFSLEYPCHSPTEKRWFLMVVTPLKGNKGGAVVVHNDVTDGKLATESVQESEKRFRNMAETAPVIIWMSDEEQSTTYLNRQWMRFTGSDLEKEMGLEWTRHLHPDDLSPTLGIYNDAFERREPFELEFRARRKDGAYRWLVASGAPRFTREGKFLGFIGIGIDITERKAAEDALQQSELRLRMAQHAARVGTWEWDIETGTSVWSEMIWELLGLEPNDRDITVETFVEFIHPEDRDRALGKVNEVIADGEEYYDEFRVIRADGSTLWLASKGALIRSDDGKPERVLGVNIDITELKHTQHEAQELSGRLISAHEDERARLARELHDDACQNLALLSIELELLVQRPPTDGEYLRSKLKGLSERASELSIDLRRMSHQLHPARLAHLGLAPAIRGFCNEMETAHDLKIEFAEANIPPTLSESTSLNVYRIVQESLQNAVKHSGASEASVILSANGNALQLTISDNGCGFDPKVPTPEGSLGLISMRERVRLLQGTISIDSRPDSGTRIEATIPI